MEYLNSIKSLYLTPPSIEIIVDENKHKKYKYVTKDNIIIEYPTFYDNDEISGKIKLKLNNNESLIYEYIEIILYGIIIINNPENKNLSESIKNEIYKESKIILSKENKITPELIINEITNFDFDFIPKIKPFESYFGNLIQIKYFIKANIKTNNNTPPFIQNEKQICCLKIENKNICDNIIKLKNLEEINIGVENIIHVKINLEKKNFFMDDVIKGKINIIKTENIINNISMIIKKEEKYFLNNDEVIAKTNELSYYEIAEGIIEQNDEFNFQFVLKNIKNLTPTYDYKDDSDKNKNILSVKYFICFCFNDEHDYQFFKNIEINIHRMNLSDIIKINKNLNK